MGVEKSFISKLFARARGDRMAGVKFMAQNNITGQNIDDLTQEQIKLAFEQYKKAHEANGIEYTTDFNLFEESLRTNLKEASELSKFFR